MAGTVNNPKKPKSKRQPVRLRHKIQKAAAAKQRKDRKLAKSNPEWRTKLKKDPGIPNLFPYKEKLLHQIEENRLRKQGEAQRKREMNKAAKVGTTTDEAEADEMVDEDDAENDEGDMDVEGDDDNVDESNPMAALLASARAAARDYKKKRRDDPDYEEGDSMDEDFDEDDDEDEDADAGHVIEVPGGATSRKAFDKVFKSVVEQADVVLYVLDARDPEGTRSRDVEQAVLAAAGGDAGKRLILVLNKVDLIPPPVLRAWLTHLRGSFPTLPLRASGPAPNAQTFNHRDISVQSTSGTLFRALKSFAATRNLKRAISVGVIGYPNVGKSSVINALLSRLGGNSRNGSGQRNACPAGAEAGVTTAIRNVKIDSRLTLLDSPGIVFPSSSTTSSASSGPKSAADVQAGLILLNAVPPKMIDDPVPAVTLLLKRLSAAGAEMMKKLTDVYDLPPLMTSRETGDVTTDFLVQVARKRGRLGRGGVPNIHAAAMTVITDWRDGRIQGWVDVPKNAVAAPQDVSMTDASGAKPAPAMAPADRKEIVTEWAAEFKLEGLWGDESEAMEA
ncbi:nucleolar gtp-binding protein 2 [Ophiostoma piceae UAMH 11346]|uniref:Nucleolar gtp-binding protein 2 n=1 Tax=Ophiostoma piceae (strain UAMH 11346) TaxID=1262450 RepID=S3BYG2_OPHP1|nr:nucleolar gtp-binding protein 2 [Ophiostoma piceae UAMH 11346]